MKNGRIQIFLSLAVFVLVLAFQNCGDVNFQRAGSSSYQVSKMTGTDQLPSLINEDTSAQSYVCIIQGSGQSVRLSMQDMILDAQVGTPEAVCMSKTACEQIVAQKFVVIHAKREGYCPAKNPHVVNLDDDELQAFIAQLPH